MDDKTRALFEAVSGDSGSHREQLVSAVKQKNKEQLLELLDNSDDNDIEWLLNMAKGALNSPVFYAIIAHKFGNLK